MEPISKSVTKRKVQEQSIVRWWQEYHIQTLQLGSLAVETAATQTKST